MSEYGTELLRRQLNGKLFKAPDLSVVMNFYAPQRRIKYWFYGHAFLLPPTSIVPSTLFQPYLLVPRIMETDNIVSST